jgi:hypothetical protein
MHFPAEIVRCAGQQKSEKGAERTQKGHSRLYSRDYPPRGIALHALHTTQQHPTALYSSHTVFRGVRSLVLAGSSV